MTSLTFCSRIQVCVLLKKSHLDWDEKASEMCYGAQATDCWTFATTKENKIPCMIPMVEETEEGFQINAY